MIKFVYFLVVMLSAFQARSQEPYAQHFSLSNGLPSNSVYSLLEDKQGFIWFTCDEGLIRYDGINFKMYRSKQQVSYAGSSVLEDKQGRIWYENFDGNAFYVKNDELVKFPQKTNTNFYPLKSTNKLIFIQEKQKIIAVDLRTLLHVKTFEINGFAYSCEVVNNKFYYIDEQKLYEIDENLVLRKVTDLPFTKLELPLLATSKNTLYFTLKNSTENKIWKLEGSKLKQMAKIKTGQIIQNFRIIKNQIFLLTTKGVYSFDAKTFKKQASYFHEKNITDVLKDRKGNIWLSSSMDGIDVIPNYQVKLFQFKGIFPLRSVNYKNQLLISTLNEQVLIFDPNKYRFETVSSGTCNALPYYLFIDDARNELVRSQSDGYTYFMDLETKKLLLKTVFAVKYIAPLDHKYNAFVSTGFNGFYCHKTELKKFSKYDKWIATLEKKDEGTIIFYRLPIDSRGKMVFIDPAKNRLYYLTNTGTFIWADGRLNQVVFKGNTKILNKLFYWNDRLLAFAINGKIIDAYAPKHFPENITLSNLEQVKQVRVLADKLYVRTSLKLLVYGLKKDRTSFLENSFDLSNLECNDFSVIGNTVWIMTSNGFINWSQAIKKTNNKAGKWLIRRLKINDTEYSSFPVKSLSYNENNITIDFALLDFGIRTINHLEYKINGKNWVAIDPLIRTLSFPALAPANYTIQIRGEVNGELTNFQQLIFSIKPPFYSTTWFWMLLFLTVVSIIIWYYRKQLKANKMRDQLINDKIILESDLNKSLLASIKSQMNPHFIFNALNTIQAYIYINDRDNASRYLSKFSKLTRSILEMSEKEEISLSDELNALKLYLDLEKMRFQEGFEYRIATNKIDLVHVKIPSMLIQPYVENAIKHGLMHREGLKKLTLSFLIDEGVLIIEIEDNGIGRKKSEELNQQRGKYHESFSSNANKQRMNIINRGNLLSVKYIDRVNEHKNAIGTKVRIKIKLKQ